MSLGDLETQQDWNGLLACCPCQMPLCPVIVAICKSLSGSFTSVGFVKAEDTEFTLYKKQGWTGTWNREETVNFEDVHPDVDGSPARILTVALTTFFGQTYDILYSGSVGGGGEGCPFYSPALADTCTAVGSASEKAYYAFGYSTGEFPDIEHHGVSGLGFEIEQVVADVSGQETEEHAAWDGMFETAIEDWEAAHPSGPTWQEANTAHDTWQTATDTHTQWETNRDGWVAEDPENRDPSDYGEVEAEPANPGSEPDDPQIDDEPTENYPPCWFKITQTITIHPFYFNGYGSVPGVEDPSDPEAFDAWVAAGASGDPPAPGSYSVRSYMALSVVPAGMNPGFTGDPSYAETYGVTEPFSYTDWLAAVQAVIDAELTLPKPDCDSDLCTAHFSKTPAPETREEGDPPFGADDLAVSVRRAEVTFQIPATWPDQFSGLTVPFPGDYYGITYNILDSPEGWDETIDDPDYEPPEEEPEGGWPPVPQVPKPGRPNRSFVPNPGAGMGDDPADWTLEWSGPGSGDQSDPSWLTVAVALDPPDSGVTRSVVNVRFICQPDSPWGTLPQVTGTAVVLAEEDP